MEMVEEEAHQRTIAVKVPDQVHSSSSVPVLVRLFVSIGVYKWRVLKKDIFLLWDIVC